MCVGLIVGAKEVGAVDGLSVGVVVGDREGAIVSAHWFSLPGIARKPSRHSHTQCRPGIVP